jgi:hypothetical protein
VCLLEHNIDNAFWTKAASSGISSIGFSQFCAQLIFNNYHNYGLVEGRKWIVYLLFPGNISRQFNNTFLFRVCVCVRVYEIFVKIIWRHGINPVRGLI